MRRIITVLLVGAWGIELNSEETLRAAVKRKPRDPATRMKLVQWHLQWGELQKATTELETAAEKDAANAWLYREQLGEVRLSFARDERGAEDHFKEALKLNPAARRSLLQYGTLSLWRGRRKEAETLFQQAVSAGLLADARQRPLEVSRSTPLSRTPWHDASTLPSLATAATRLSEQRADILAEYLKWAKTRAKDGEADGDGVEEPLARGRWRHFWIHRPRFERGIWRDACSYKTPKTCTLLKALNNTGPAGEKLVVLQADFDVLGPGGRIRPHCHPDDRETVILLPLLAPRLGPNRTSALKVGGEERQWVEGRCTVIDATFEQEEALPALPDAAEAGEVVDYAEELRLFYAAQGMQDKEKEIPDILTKWSGKKEKMMRKLREKYLEGWKSERVALRLLVRSAVFKSARAEL